MSWPWPACVAINRKPHALAVQRIRSPDMLVRLRSDKRFDGLVDRQAAQFDVASAARKLVIARREQANGATTVSQEAVDLARAMLVAGDHEAVLELTERLLAVPPATDAAPSDVQLRAWLGNNHSTALLRLGRTAEALAELEQAARMQPNGKPNINQALNLSHFYCSLGRGQDTLATANGVGKDMNATEGQCRLKRSIAPPCCSAILPARRKHWRTWKRIKNQARIPTCWPCFAPTEWRKRPGRLSTGSRRKSRAAKCSTACRSSLKSSLRRQTSGSMHVGRPCRPGTM